MVFSSFSFLFFFFPLVLILYYAGFRYTKNVILLIFSLIFYAWGEPVYIILMLLSITINYITGLLIERNIASNRMLSARSNLILAAVWNLFAIAFFKYYPFLVSNVNGIFPDLLPDYNLSLPIGISFYTFQALSYVIDVYRQKVPAQHNYISFALYISMFPQLIAGPIVRYSDVAREIKNRTLSLHDFASGSERFIIGLSKKVLLANTFGIIFENIQGLDSSHQAIITAWIGALSYAFQIYFDFSGYSDMAIGIGRMLGFHFIENFNYPYLAKSITDFWQRWHISLSSWFKEYLYIPLGGNRKGALIQIRNILIVWMLTGLWHGANWNFIFWGLYYGILLILEKFIFASFIKRFPKIYRILTLFFILISWMLFANADFSALFGFGKIAFLNQTTWYYLKSSILILAIGAFACLPFLNPYGKHIKKKAPFLAVALLTGLLLLCIVSLISQSYNPFLYFRF